MGRRKKGTPSSDHVDPSAHWVVSEEWKVNGRNLVKGTELSIRDERGRFQFLRHVYNPKLDVEWIDVIGGPKGTRQCRSFHPQRVKRVHWKNKTGENLAKARKEAKSTDTVE